MLALFYDFSKSVLEKHDALMEEIHEARGLNMGQLRIAALFTTLYLLSIRIELASNCYPGNLTPRKRTWCENFLICFVNRQGANCPPHPLTPNFTTDIFYV